MRLLPSFCLLFTVTALTNCSKPQDEGSNTQYVLLGRGYDGLLAHVKEPSMKICLQGDSADQKWAKWTKESMVKWLVPLRDISDTDLTERFDIVTNAANCGGSVGYITVHQGNFRAYTSVGRVPRIEVSEQDHRNGTVIFHELGHALSLGDTYDDRGDTGQPDSVMKTARFKELKADDVKSIRAAYVGIFGSEKPADTGPKEKIYLGLNGTDDENSFRFFFSSAKTLSEGLSYCLSDTGPCLESDSWVTAKTEQTTGGKDVMASAVYKASDENPYYISARGQQIDGKKAAGYFKIHAKTQAYAAQPSDHTVAYDEDKSGPLLNGDTK